MDLSQCLAVSGGLSIGGVQFIVFSEGIPTYDYAHLDYAFSQLCSDAWSDEQAYAYLRNSGSMKYLPIFQENFAKAYYDAISN